MERKFFVLSLFALFLVIGCTSKVNSPRDSIEEKKPEYRLEDLKQRVVHIRHDVTGCCDASLSYSSRFGGSGSGVILFQDRKEVFLATSRHVVDCIFSRTCTYPINESVTIRTNDGTFYEAERMYYVPQSVDLAVIIFTAPQGLFPSNISSFLSDGYNVGDAITAIGYPMANLESPEPILELLVSTGKIRNVYNLLTYKGFSFTAIEGDAISSHGSSGGGIFSDTGKLLGIVSWGYAERRATIAIDARFLKTLIENEEYVACQKGSYMLLDGQCCAYGTAMGTDKKCHETCGSPLLYCAESDVCCNNVCTSKCPEGYIFNDYCSCKPACGAGYCEFEGVCCNNLCIDNCPTGKVDKDCYCLTLTGAKRSDFKVTYPPRIPTRR